MCLNVKESLWPDDNKTIMFLQTSKNEVIKIMLYFRNDQFYKFIKNCSLTHPVLELKHS